jgi:hypothetical protein
VTDSPGSPGSPEPTESAEIEELRRLLADARHTEPMPDAVVARMDDVLAGLRETAPESSPVTPPGDGIVVTLSARRRRRAAGLLVAAAAIVVGGVALAQNLPSSSSSSSTTAEANAGGNTQDSLGSTGNAPRPHKNEQRVTGGKATFAPNAFSRGRLVVRPRRFSTDASAGRQLLRRPADAVSDLQGCASVPTDAGQVVPATYRGAPAALVYLPVSGGSQVVDLYLCGTAAPVRSATLPAP